MNWFQRLLDRLFPKPRLVYTGELPPFLKEVVDEYMEAQRTGQPFTINVKIRSNEVVMDLARCPHCTQKNKLDKRGIVGARCAACGLALELLPKAKRKDLVQ